jgi:hypothetical protein
MFNIQELPRVPPRPPAIRYFGWESHTHEHVCAVEIVRVSKNARNQAGMYRVDVNMYNSTVDMHVNLL